jgi:hypothetical protein
MRPTIYSKISRFILVSGLVIFFFILTVTVIASAQVSTPHTIPTPPTTVPTPSIIPQTPPATLPTPPTTVPTPSIIPQTPPAALPTPPTTVPTPSITPASPTRSEQNYLFGQILNFFNGIFGWKPVLPTSVTTITPTPVPTIHDS